MTTPWSQGAFPTPPAPVSPREDFARLLRDAAEGLPVAGRTPTWEADRPKTLPVGEPVKVQTLVRVCLLKLAAQPTSWEAGRPSCQHSAVTR